MGQLRLNAIDAQLDTGFRGFMLAMVRGAGWELTCGFCKQRFRKVIFLTWSSAVCPFCGTRNLLPVTRFTNDPGRRR